jgi:hypothetical protein
MVLAVQAEIDDGDSDEEEWLDFMDDDHNINFSVSNMDMSSFDMDSMHVEHDDDVIPPVAVEDALQQI